MIKIDEINQEIAKLESTDRLTYDICYRLAILYIVRDHLCEDDDCYCKNNKPISSLEITK